MKDSKVVYQEYDDAIRLAFYETSSNYLLLLMHSSITNLIYNSRVDGGVIFHQRT